MGTDYTISVKDVKEIVVTLDGLLADYESTTADLGRTTIPPGCYGQVGATTEQSGRSTQDQLLITLQVLAKVLHLLNRRIAASAHDYDRADHECAAVTDGLTGTQENQFASYESSSTIRDSWRG